MTDQPSLSETRHSAIIAALIGIICCLALIPPDARAEKVQVKVPLVLPADARTGKKIFDANCRRCHGRNLSGTDKGPALILYEKGHHGDGMFFQAVRSGVRAHHWKFGDMPALDTLMDDEIAFVIRYVRELQKFNEND